MAGDVIVLELYRDATGLVPVTWYQWRRLDGDGEVVRTSTRSWEHEADCFDDLVLHNPDYEGRVVYEDTAAETDGGTPGVGNGFVRGPVAGYTVRPGVWSRTDPRP